MNGTPLIARATLWVLAGALNVVGIAVVLGWAAAGGTPTLGEGDVSQRVRDLLWFALLCGLSAFATIEILKRVLALRGFYQRFQTRRWLTDRSRGDARAFEQLLAAMGLSDERSPADPATSFQRQLELSNERRVFNLPTEQLAAQISAAADVALAAEGREFVVFLAALTGTPPRAVEAAFIEDLRAELPEDLRRPPPGASSDCRSECGPGSTSCRFRLRSGGAASCRARRCGSPAPMVFSWRRSRSREWPENRR